MADQGRFEAAAKRGAVNGGNDGLRAALKCGLDFGYRGALWGLAEFGNVGAGNEGAAGANQDDGFDGWVRGGLAGAIAKTVAHVLGERVDGR